MTILSPSPAIHWPFSESRVERWKHQAATNECSRSALAICGCWSARSDAERFVVTSLLDLNEDTILRDVLDCFLRPIVVTPLAGAYEYPTGYHLALNGSPPRGQAYICFLSGDRLEARYQPWREDGWKPMPQAMADQMLSYARSVTPKTFPT